MNKEKHKQQLESAKDQLTAKKMLGHIKRCPSCNSTNLIYSMGMGTSKKKHPLRHQR